MENKPKEDKWRKVGMKKKELRESDKETKKKKTLEKKHLK